MYIVSSVRELYPILWPGTLAGSPSPKCQALAAGEACRQNAALAGPCFTVTRLDCSIAQGLLSIVEREGLPLIKTLDFFAGCPSLRNDVCWVFQGLNIVTKFLLI